jgi:hypothetical protein
MKSFIKNITSLEDRNNAVFLGDPSDLAVSGDVIPILDQQNNLYKRFENDGELSGNQIVALPGYTMGVVINIDGYANIYLNYSSDESAIDPVAGPIVLPIYLRGQYAGTSDNFTKYTDEILTADNYPIGKTPYLDDNTGMAPDGSNGVQVNVVLVSCGGSRGLIL